MPHTDAESTAFGRFCFTSSYRPPTSSFTCSRCQSSHVGRSPTGMDSYAAMLAASLEYPLPE